MVSSSMVIAILGGLGLFLLGMGVMTDGLRSLAGSALRRLLMRAAATPAKGAFWGAGVTLLVQSSSATTMTTIGLVSAGLLTFPQAIGVVFGANIGTTGTGWLVALAGVKFSLTAAAMPMVFVGALLRLLGRGRLVGVGSAMAGLGLLLAGLTVLQQGMSDLATRVNPSDLPAITGVGSVGAVVGVLELVVAGIVMTTVMQSSSAAVAATLTALHAGAIAPDQAAALVVGQNIGTSVSAVIAAIGGTTAARRTAAAHVMFNVLTACAVLALFPLVIPLIDWAAPRTDPTMLLAAFHTAYNVLGVAILLPMVGPFSRLVERMLPERGPMLTRHLDQSVLAVPAVAVEAARRTIACTLQALCGSIARTLEQSTRSSGGAIDQDLLSRATDALDQVRLFLAGLSAPPATEPEQRRLDDALHALDHTARLADNARSTIDTPVWTLAAGDAEAVRAAVLCSQALHLAGVVAELEASGAPKNGDDGSQASAVVTDLARQSTELADLRRTHRRATLSAAAVGGARDGDRAHAPAHAHAGSSITVDAAIARVDQVRRLDRLAHHAWRAAAHLDGSSKPIDGTSAQRGDGTGGPAGAGEPIGTT